jgi:uncharacterized protein
MKKIDWIVALLLVIGAINWGLIGMFDFDAIGFIFGSFLIDRVIYILIGIAGVYRGVVWAKSLKKR